MTAERSEGTPKGLARPRRRRGLVVARHDLTFDYGSRCMLLTKVGMRIGQLARLSRTSTATLRYYERRGLLRRPARTKSGYRSYTPEALAQLRLIRWAKGLGFTLREVQEITGAIGQHALGRGDRVRAQLRAKIAEVDAKIQQFVSMRAQLQSLAACRCRSDCPVIEQVLTGTPEPGRRRRQE